MGVYSRTSVYYGFRVSSSEKDKLKSGMCFFEDDKGINVYAPNTIHHFEDVNSVIEDEEFEQGHVKMQEVENCLGKKMIVEENDKKNLEEFAKKFGINQNEINWHIIEVEWNTYGNDLRYVCRLPLSKDLS